MTPTSLASLCGIFQRMAQKATLSLKQNTNPILEEISAAKDYDERVKIAKKHWKKLGEGSARAVFQINGKLIIKVAINDKGIAQNLSEMRPENRGECVNPVIMGDAKGKWLIARWSKTITKAEFKEHVGFGFDNFVNCLSYALNNESDKKKPKDYDEIKHTKLFSCLVRLTIDNDLLVGDEKKISSFGLLDGKIVIRDTGFSRAVWKKEYSHSSSSESPDRTSSSGSG
jgi:hypothetical protein